MFQFQLLRLLSCLSETVSFLKTFGYLYDAFEIGEKGNTEGRERGCRQSLYRGTKNFWQRRWKTYTQFLTSFNTKHLVLWTMPKTFEIEWRNRLKDIWIRSGLHSRKVELSHVKYFHAFLSTLNYLSPIRANHDKRRWSWDGDGLARKLSTCLPCNKL